MYFIFYLQSPNVIDLIQNKLFYSSINIDYNIYCCDELKFKANKTVDK